MVPLYCPLPLFIEPLGAVDKATPPWWRLILDARISNEFQDAWGVWYFSVSQLAALLASDVCDIMFAEDLEDAYHLSIFSGCTGRGGRPRRDGRGGSGVGSPGARRRSGSADAD